MLDPTPVLLAFNDPAGESLQSFQEATGENLFAFAGK